MKFKLIKNKIKCNISNEAETLRVLDADQSLFFYEQSFENFAITFCARVSDALTKIAEIDSMKVQDEMLRTAIVSTIVADVFCDIHKIKLYRLRREAFRAQYVKAFFNFHDRFNYFFLISKSIQSEQADNEIFVNVNCAIKSFMTAPSNETLTQVKLAISQLSEFVSETAANKEIDARVEITNLLIAA